MKSVSAVLLSGGSGSRMGGSCPKQFLELNGKPVFAYSLEALSGFPEIGEIVIVYREGTRKEIENIIAALKIELPPLLCSRRASPVGSRRTPAIPAARAEEGIYFLKNDFRQKSAPSFRYQYHPIAANADMAK